MNTESSGDREGATSHQEGSGEANLVQQLQGPPLQGEPEHAGPADAAMAAEEAVQHLFAPARDAALAQSRQPEAEAPQPQAETAPQEQAPAPEGNTDPSERDEQAGEKLQPSDLKTLEQAVDMLRQDSDDLETLYREARPAQKELEAFIRYYTQKYGGNALIEELKKLERAQEKVRGEYDGDAARLKDLARSGIVFDKLEKVNFERVRAALREFSPEGQIRIEGLKDRFAHPRPSGYSDMALYIRMSNGHIAELQLHLASMLAAKHEEEYLYRLSRTRKAEAKARGGLTPEDQQQLANWLQESRTIYYKAWAEASRQS